ncbi:hypothetical protein ADS79_31835 [Brevibacillus reuszeri]|uniref:Uncharacterized protein n=1 Tax=Brevibacillus reuszeri TaxID=54915 RepID=A0A0K9YIR7_9BACL|nr:hypothetical protein ADS79_31835 [Brevibacillus reuszeri]
MAKRQRIQPAVCINFDHSVVANTISEDALGFKHSPVEKLDEDVFGFANHMLTGQNVAFRMKNESGTKATFSWRRWLFFINQAAD